MVDHTADLRDVRMAASLAVQMVAKRVDSTVAYLVDRLAASMVVKWVVWMAAW